MPSHSRVLPNSRAFCQETEEESKRIIDPSKDRSKVIPVEVSVKYLQSSGKLLFYFYYYLFHFLLI